MTDLENSQPAVPAQNHSALLDKALFGPPYIHIAADNSPVSVTRRHPCSISGHPNDAVSTVGTLHPAACGIDVDPTDTGATPESGHAFSDAIVSWCERLGLPWLRRSSGRPGHVHLIAVVPPALRPELRTLSAHLARHHAVSATVRTTLRLTSAPHRLGFPSLIIDGTLQTRDLPGRPLQRDRARAPARARRPRPAPRSPHQRSRSEGEYGDALAHARANWTTERAWHAANVSGSKAADIGRHAWQRWFWAPAQTIVDAERGLPEHSAWRRFTQASPTQGKHLGHARWRTERWLPALDEARLDRPRRQRVHTSPRAPASSHEQCRQHHQISVVRRTLRITASLRLHSTQSRVKPTTLYAALDALAMAIVARSGSLSIRSWAEKALLDPKSIRRARDTADHLGLIYRTHAYHGGPNDCDSWQLTGQLTDLIARHTGQSPTIPYTPHARCFGAANYERLRRTHWYEQQLWRALWIWQTRKPQNEFHRVTRIQLQPPSQTENGERSRVSSAIGQDADRYAAASTRNIFRKRRTGRRGIRRTAAQDSSHRRADQAWRLAPEVLPIHRDRRLRPAARAQDLPAQKPEDRDPAPRLLALPAVFRSRDHPD